MSVIQTLMQTELIDASVGETVADVASRMAQNKVGALLVRDGDRLAGIFSERDLLQRVVSKGQDPSSTKIDDVMTGNVVTVELSAPVKEVLEVFRKARVRHVPIVNNGKPVGILSTRDFLSFLVDGLERYIEEVAYSSEISEGTDPYDHIGGSYGR